MSDRQLANTARRYLKAKATTAHYANLESSLKAQLIEQIEMRKVTEWIFGGIRILRRQNTNYKVSLEALLTVGKKQLFERLTVRTLDRAQYNAAVSSGLLGEKQLKLIETPAPTAPWVDVSEVEQ